MQIEPRTYYFTRGRHGSGQLRAVKAVDTEKNGCVLTYDALNGKIASIEAKAFVKKTDRAEIAKTLGRHIDTIL